MYNNDKSPKDINDINNNEGLVTGMETRVKPELVLKRKVCTSCGEKEFEFTENLKEIYRHICTECLT